jgi:S-adenosylmethionine:diacylglycerol 3-amino-3-carboxypropyl transferase
MIFYSHVNEDNIVEKYWMNQTSFQNLVCISGSGERVLALMGHSSLEQLFVVDSNLEALHLIELKLRALEKLSIKNYLEFIGISPSQNRVRTFKLIKTELTSPSRFFWEKKSYLIEKGVIHIGHFEQFLAKFRPLFKIFLVV